MTALITPSPYLRDGLRTMADELRERANNAYETALEAGREVARLRKLLADAEQAAERADAEHDGLLGAVRWTDQQVAHLDAQIDADPAERLADVGLMSATPDEPRRQDNGLPMVWSPMDPPGGYVCAVPMASGGRGIDLPDGSRVCGMPVESEPCDLHGEGDAPSLSAPPGSDDLTAPGVVDSRQEIAAITGGIPVVPPPTPDGPLVTMPDTGLAPPPLEPAAPCDGPRHEKARTSRLTGPFRALGLISRDQHDDEQGDDRG